MDLKAAEGLVGDIRFGSSYGFLVSAYRSSMYFWESVDMARKLLLVGLILMFGRGSALQLAAALATSTVFAMAHIYFLPFKLPLDNLLRFTTETHTVLTILLATSIKADSQAAERQATYDTFAVGTFVALVVLPFVLVVAGKLRAVRNTMRQSLTQAKTSQTADVRMAIRRFQLGLQSAEDRQIVSRSRWRDRLLGPFVP